MQQANAPSSAGVDLLQSIALFERLPSEVSDRVMLGHHYQSVEAGEVVVARGEKVPYFNCLLGGLVKLQVRGGRQKERIIDLVEPGQCFCMASVFLDLPCPIKAVALEPGRLLALRRESVIEAATSHPPLLLRLLGRLSLQLYQQIRAAEADAETSSAERVVRWLLSRLASAADERTIVLGVSKKTVAGSLNVTPETFSRVLRHLRQAGLIEVAGRKIRVLDAVRLKAARPHVFGVLAERIFFPTGEAPAGGAEIDALHWLDGMEQTGDVPHWFKHD